MYTCIIDVEIDDVRYTYRYVYLEMRKEIAINRQKRNKIGMGIFTNINIL